MVIDGKEGNKYDKILTDGIIFSPDGRVIAYGAKKGGKPVVVINGKEAVFGSAKK